MFQSLQCLVYKGGNIKGEPPSSSCGVCELFDGCQFYLYLFLYSLCEECDKAEAKSGYFDRFGGLYVAHMETLDARVGF